jgi:hypothetical protein
MSFAIYFSTDTVNRLKGGTTTTTTEEIKMCTKKELGKKSFYNYFDGFSTEFYEANRWMDAGVLLYPSIFPYRWGGKKQQPNAVYFQYISIVFNFECQRKL